MAGKRRIIVEDDDPLYRASVYWRAPNPEAGRKGEETASSLRRIQGSLPLTKMPIPPLKGKVSRAQYQRALDVYENNQSYYSYLLESGWRPQQVQKELSELEWWFLLVQEPKPGAEEVEDWIDRERHKLRTWRTAHCDDALSPVVLTPPPDLQREIVQQLSALNSSRSR